MSDHGTPAGDERSESLADWYRDVRVRLSSGVEGSVIAGLGRRAAGTGDRLADVVRGSWLYRWLTAEPEPDVIVIDLRETYTVGPFIRLLDVFLGRAAEWADGSRFVSGVKVGIDRTTAAPLRIGGACLVVAGTIGLIASILSGDPSTAARVGLAGLLLVGALATRDQRSWTELRETRPVRLLVAAFEPPEPPDSMNSPGSMESPESTRSPKSTEQSKPTETPKADDDRGPTG